MHRFLVVIERAERINSAYFPDLPGCVATWKTHEEAEQGTQQAIEMYVRGLEQDNLPVPEGQFSDEDMSVK